MDRIGNPSPGMSPSPKCLGGLALNNGSHCLSPDNHLPASPLLGWGLLVRRHESQAFVACAGWLPALSRRSRCEVRLLVRAPPPGTTRYRLAHTRMRVGVSTHMLNTRTRMILRRWRNYMVTVMPHQAAGQYAGIGHEPGRRQHRSATRWRLLLQSPLKSMEGGSRRRLRYCCYWYWGRENTTSGAVAAMVGSHVINPEGCSGYDVIGVNARNRLLSVIQRVA